MKRETTVQQPGERSELQLVAEKPVLEPEPRVSGSLPPGEVASLDHALCPSPTPSFLA